MRVPIKWLKDYIDIDMSAIELSDKLTLSGSKVEEVITAGDEVENVVTGKIVKIEPHPDADKLVICQVDIGLEDNIQIVTAAKNMKEQDIVPVALHGSTLHGGLKIKKGKLRGVVSNGMFCSEEELGIADEKEIKGLMILPQDTPIGKDIKEVLGLNNSVLDLEITSNRPDCLSILGIAREVSAVLNRKYNIPALNYNSTCKENIKDVLKVDVKDALCKRYMARGVKNVVIKESPKWIQERLIEAGIRPINNIVDITNFVMLEFGQPMHAFDSRQITSNKIVVDKANDDEKFITLDQQERKLDSSMLTIKDDDRVVALAGIMGGMNSEVKDDTKEVIFECANFECINVRVTSKKLGLRTESSSRFEKGLDPNVIGMAMDRACNLVEELGAGEVMEGTIDIYNEKSSPKILEVDYKWINKFLGTDISKENMKNYLDRLELNTEIKDDLLVINVPTFRIDINIKEDIAEEIARIYGYNNIEGTSMDTSSIKSGKSLKHILEEKVISTLLASGLNQSISYSLVSPKMFDKILLPKDSELRKTIVIRNPLGEDYSIMRTTTIPSMMEALSRNYLRNNSKAALFEMGKVYIPNVDSNELPEERNVLTIGMYGDVDYFDLKGVVENVLGNFAIKKASFKRESDNVTFHPGKTAALYVNKEYVGVLGEVYPDVMENYEIETNCYVAELNLDILYKNANIDKKYKPLPKFPAVSRDIALIVDDNILVEEIENIILNQGGKMVETIKLFDVYKGKQIPEGKKSIAYSITYRLENKTLTDKEVNKVHDRIVRTLENKLGAHLRE